MGSLRLILVAALLGLGALLWFLPSAPPPPVDSAAPESVAESVELEETATALGERNAAASVATQVPGVPVPSPTAGFAGRVLYPDGSPVGAGFEVLAFLEGVEPPVPSARVTTDADGAFVLPDSLAGGAFVLDAAGSGWGTDRRTPLDSENALELPSIELTVQPLYAALLQARTDGPNGARAEFLGSAELQVLPMVARQVENLALQHWHGAPGWDLLVYTPAKAGDTPDALPGQIICRGLDRPKPTGHPLFVPRWNTESVVRLDSNPCWSQGPFASLEVSISGGVGWELLAQDYILATLSLSSQTRTVLRAPLTVAQWSAGFAEFRVPQGSYDWKLAPNARENLPLSSGTVDVEHGAGQITVALGELGGIVLDVRYEDGTAFEGPLRATLLHSMVTTTHTTIHGREFLMRGGIGGEEAWSQAPYVAAFLTPGEYGVGSASRPSVGTVLPMTQSQPTASVSAGKLATLRLELRSEPR